MSDYGAQHNYKVYSAYNRMIDAYNAAMMSLMSSMIYMASNYSSTNPGNFMLMQFNMQQTSQVGNSITNWMMAVGNVVSNIVQAYKQS